MMKVNDTFTQSAAAAQNMSYRFSWSPDYHFAMGKQARHSIKGFRWHVSIARASVCSSAIHMPFQDASDCAISLPCFRKRLLLPLLCLELDSSCFFPQNCPTFLAPFLLT